MFSQGSFYGKKRMYDDLHIRLQRREKRLQCEKIPQPYKKRLVESKNTVWKIFHRQQEAFDFIRKYQTGLHIFSYESISFGDNCGKRMYLAATYDHFWHFYRQLLPEKRHHYEVIPEDAACHLYFDLEFSKILNPDEDGQKMVEIFIKYVCSWLRQTFDVCCDKQDVLDLRASTDAKFSCHLIFHMENAVFKDNIQAGHFVHHICSLLGKYTIHTEDMSSVNITTRSHGSLSSDEGYQGSPTITKGQGADIKDDKTEFQDVLNKSGLTLTDLESLIVSDRDDKPALFCDLGVYTKNRNFRLYQSRKLGKNNPLVLAEENAFKPDDDESDEEMSIFLSSLISNVRFSEELKVLSFKETTEHVRSSGQKKESNKCDGKTLDGNTSSPYPEVDQFIMSLLNKGGTSGYIRRWVYFHQGEILTYDIGKNRWCENIGRQHKSNNVLYVADLRKGVYYQKCHDPDCKRSMYKSPERLLPDNVLPAGILGDLDDTDGFGEDYQFSSSEDDLSLMNAVKQIESSSSSQWDVSDDELVSAALACEQAQDN